MSKVIDFSLPVRFAADCPDCETCGEAWCPVHQMHYAECPCPGPFSDLAELDNVEALERLEVTWTDEDD